MIEIKGNSEQNQLELIQSYCGSINSDVWCGVEKLELFNKLNLFFCLLNLYLFIYLYR